jgi:prolyl oligopeptidase
MMKKSLISFTMVSLLACQPKGFEYPDTRKDNTVDNYFGTLVPDPYRWLEDDRSAETEAWVKAQNRVTFAYLEKIPYRERIRERLTSLMDYPKSGAPWRDGIHYLVERNTGLQDQHVYFITRDIDLEPEVFIDPNAFSEDGTVAVTGVVLSGNGKFAAYSLSRAGSDWQEIFVRNVETGEDLDDHILWTKFASIAWYGDGFYYSRFEPPGADRELSGKNVNNKVYYHQMGNGQEQDELVYWNPDRDDLTYLPQITRGSQYLCLYTFKSTSGNAIIVADLSKEDRKFREVLKGFKHNYHPIGVIEDRLYLLTDEHAGRYRVVAVDLKAERDLIEIVPEQEDRVMTQAAIAGGQLIIQFMKDAQDLLGLYDMDGHHLEDPELPGPGAITALHADKDDPNIFYSFESFTVPPTVYQYNIETGQTQEYHSPEIDFDPAQYVTKQVFYHNKDGTRVPLFIVHGREVQQDGQNPVLLYGYGGFNVTVKPGFRTDRIVWLENGGIYASANIRGGGEYGEAWHREGMVLNKQHVFDDFIAAAEYLIDHRYTSAEKLAIRGGSNGGLLVGAVLNQRPELFRVAFPAVGVMDMLRFHKFTIGYYWTVDYGSSDDPVQFEYLYRYSPLHNIRPGSVYPAVLIETADHDDRVVPAHSFKYAATLQACYKGPNPVLIRIETDAGHGAGKPISKVIDAMTDVYAFAFFNLGMAPIYR